MVGENSVLCLSQIYDYAYNKVLEFVVMKKVPKEEARKTVLTLACNAVTYNINSLTFQFNRYNPDYRIKILDYSKYNSQSDQTAGINMLNIDLSNGKIPDILALDGLPYETYAAKELFENLYPYIDADAELGGRGGIVPAILKASESPSGELYQIALEFDIRTMRANSKYAGSENSWSLDEFNAILKANPQMSMLGKSASRHDILQQILQVNMDEFLNFKTGEVRLDSPEFIQLLEFAQKFPETAKEEYITVVDAEKSSIDEGKQLAGVAVINDVREFMWDLTLTGGNCVYKGFPCADGNGSSFHLYEPLAMTEACSDKKGAWTFMRNILGTEHQREVALNLPTNKQLFDAQFEGLLAVNYKVPIYDENGELIPPDLSEIGPYDIVDEYGGVLRPNGLAGRYTEDGKDIDIPYYTMTDEQYTRVMNFINSVDRLDRQDEFLSVIISEEVAPYFAGQKDAKSAVKIIQSRAEIYVNERR
jgi:ABC-type glycerol-3-phosphate transport system substrate-binding protein